MAGSTPVRVSLPSESAVASPRRTAPLPAARLRYERPVILTGRRRLYPAELQSSTRADLST